jgi:4-methyl-5(b-hydroxyethyl)-thiazole monophosphate biosynthesis
VKENVGMPSVLVPLAPGFEDLEAATIVDLLRRGGVEVVTAGLEPGLIQGSRGMRVTPDAYLDDVMARRFDMIALPGGLPGAERLRTDGRVQALLRQFGERGMFTAAICAAPMALAEAGLLAGRKATSYPGSLEKYAPPGMTLLTAPVVVDGRVVTSRGPGTAMDFALQLVELLMGKERRDDVEAGLLRPQQ